jgi:hypothetical protein
MPAILATAATALALLSGTAPALATSHSPAGDQAATPAPGGAELRFAGFDREVAEQHGFEVVTDAEGREASIPVTDEAKAAGGGIDEDVPACGAAWLDLFRRDHGLSISTGIVMPMDIDTVHLRVRGQANGTGANHVATPFEITFDDSQGIGRRWESSAFQSLPRTSGGGSAHLTIDSYVVLANGATCEMGGTRATF